MAKGLGISGILNPESLAQARGTHTVSYIRLDKITDHQKNRKYNPRKIEALARDIEDTGLQTPILVAEVSEDQYVAISGHRRLAAFRLLLAEGKEAYQTIPAICRKGLSEAQIEEMLYDGNLFTEMPTDAELAAQLAWKKKRLQERKAAGEKIPGKLLELLADELGISEEAARRLDRVNRTAIPEVQEEFAKGSISLNEAYYAARQEHSKQRDLIQKKKAGGIALLYEETKKGVNLHPETQTDEQIGGVNLHPENQTDEQIGGVNLHPETHTDEQIGGVNLHPETQTDEQIGGVNLHPENQTDEQIEGVNLHPGLIALKIKCVLSYAGELMEWVSATEQPEKIRQLVITLQATAMKLENHVKHLEEKE